MRFFWGFTITLWVIEAHDKSFILHSRHRSPWPQRSPTTTRWPCHWGAVTRPRQLKWGISAAATSFSSRRSLPPCHLRSHLHPLCSSLLWALGDATSTAISPWRCWMGRYRTGKDSISFSSHDFLSFFFSLFVFRNQHLHYVILKYVITNHKVLRIIKPIY